jgi:hypothetical protein
MGTLRRIEESRQGIVCKKKASGTSPTGHDYRQPKVEEGTDAFWQVRKK